MNKKIDCPGLWRYVAATIALLVGCFAIIAGLFINPAGVIHPSVLTGFGEALSFAGAIFGIDTSYRYKYYSKEKYTSQKEENTQNS